MPKMNVEYSLYVNKSVQARTGFLRDRISYEPLGTGSVKKQNKWYYLGQEIFGDQFMPILE